MIIGWWRRRPHGRPPGDVNPFHHTTPRTLSEVEHAERQQHRLTHSGDIKTYAYAAAPRRMNIYVHMPSPRGFALTTALFATKFF